MARYPAFPTFRIRPREFDKLLNSSNVTYRAIHLRADTCPCFDPTRGAPEYTCPVCGGIGRTWTAPAASAHEDALVAGSRTIPERATKALAVPGTLVATYLDDLGAIVQVAGITLDDAGFVVWPPGTIAQPGTQYTLTYDAPEQGRLHAQGITKQRYLEDRGEIVAGQMDVSIPSRLEDLDTPNPAWLAAEHDRFVFPDLKHRHQQRLTRGRNERLTYQHVRSVTGIRAIVNGALAHYALDEHATIGSSGNVTWIDASAPPAGAVYVVDYVAAPEYYVFQELPQQRHIDGMDLPRRVVLRLFEQYPHRT